MCTGAREDHGEGEGGDGNLLAREQGWQAGLNIVIILGAETLEARQKKYWDLNPTSNPFSNC